MFRRFSLIVALLLSLSACAQYHTQVLSLGFLNGRNNNTPESVEVQNYLITVFKERGIAGLNTAAAGDAAYKQAFNNGTNILGFIPGTDSPDEYVMVGAHYDHISGGACFQLGVGDTVCNGATDNAAGVGAALDIALYFSIPGNEPKRSVIIALWDREEDGLLGSAYYVNNPLRPLFDTVAYINFDILGANLLPSLRNVSIAVGAETGGPAFVSAVQSAIAEETLDVQLFSSVFGQGRSDYINLINAGVPTVFFTDSTGPCYHTTGDDMSVVDVDKLDQQVVISLDLAKQLASGGLTPVITAAPTASYDDAVSLSNLLQLGLADLDRFSPANQTNLQGWANTMATMVADGPALFDSADVNTMLSIAVQVVSLLTTGECDGFLEE